MNKTAAALMKNKLDQSMHIRLHKIEGALVAELKKMPIRYWLCQNLLLGSWASKITGISVGYYGNPQYGEVWILKNDRRIKKIKL